MTIVMEIILIILDLVGQLGKIRLEKNLHCRAPNIIIVREVDQNTSMAAIRTWVLGRSLVIID